MSLLGIKCPFCNERLHSENYKMGKGYPPKLIVFCDNDDCEVKPMTDETRPTLAFADVEAWGFVPKASETTESARAVEGG